ncbi:MAG: substrate-binding domain-containing protein [Muribaculaceae bacterium]|nr:substrate-binding domain-containing protein [Muribaculaceae bacterium]
MKDFLKKATLLSSILSLWLLPGCSREENTYRIGVAQCSEDEWRSQMNEEIRREILFHDNASVEIRSADDSNERQIADIDYFIDNGFDAIVVAPNEADALTPAVRKAFSKGIPVIVFDRTVNDSSFTTYIELDNAGVGRSAALYAADMVKSPANINILEITGLPGSSPAEERHRGFRMTLDSLGYESRVKTLHGDWRAPKAFHLTDSILRVNPDINLIYAHNDVMAISAAKAARTLGREDVIVLGTDAAPSLGIKAVADSLIDATFIYPTVGDRVIKAAIEILEGKDYPRVDHIPSHNYIDRSNADFYLSLNDLLRSKTNQIEQLNEKYTLIRNLHDSQTILLLVSVIAAIFFAIGVAGLAGLLRQKNRLQKELMTKNRQLMESSKKQDELYARLQDATHSKLVFFTNVSHDLLTPLVLIAEPIDKIAVEENLSPEGRTLLDMMKRNARILKRMIEQILDFRKYENGKASLNLQLADPEALVLEWAQMFRSLASQRKINFNVDINPKGITMAVDVDKLERIFFNLVSNALKYTPPRGSIRVACSMNQFRFRLNVTDSGRGISKEELERIFERYYQIDSTHSNGVGIGLALTKAFVELMGGEISVESTPGKGASFSVILPVKGLEEANVRDVELIPALAGTKVEEISGELILPADEPEALIESGKPRLLIIDDNKEIRRLVRIICGERYDIVEAADGKEGVRRAVKYVPDVIICDIMMPGMDGLEATRILKEERATSHIPILILTACRLDEQRVRSYDSGADGYISKPFTEEMLKSRLNSLVANRKRIYDIFKEKGGISDILDRRKNEIEQTHSLDNEFYSEFLSYVKSNISNETLSVKEIASQLGIGPTQLARKIKALTGTTPVDLVRELRLREGRELIITTERSVADIAYSLGFSTPQYFAKCFKDKYGITPSELRSSLR